MLKTAAPLPLLQDAIINMTEIASHLFREENLEIAIHGSKAKQQLIQMKLELLLNAMKNENSEFNSKHSKVEVLDEFKEGQILY